MRESQIYGNTALLFLLEPVGIYAREAQTKTVFPWSMWPALPVLMFFISTLSS